MRLEPTAPRSRVKHSTTEPLRTLGHNGMLICYGLSLHTAFFFMLFCSLLVFFNINFFKKFFQEYHQSVKQFGSRSGPTLVGPDLGPKRLQRISAGYHLVIFFQNQLFRNTIRVSNSFGSRLGLTFVGPYLGLNFL